MTVNALKINCDVMKNPKIKLCSEDDGISSFIATKRKAKARNTSKEADIFDPQSNGI
jgi:hypothetical protein